MAAQGRLVDTLRAELDRLIAEIAPVLIDLSQLGRLATEDELHQFDGECAAHDSCRPIHDKRLP